MCWNHADEQQCVWIFNACLAIAAANQCQRQHSQCRRIGWLVVLIAAYYPNRIQAYMPASESTFSYSRDLGCAKTRLDYAWNQFCARFGSFPTNRTTIIYNANFMKISTNRVLLGRSISVIFYINHLNSIFSLLLFLVYLGYPRLILRHIRQINPLEVVWWCSEEKTCREVTLLFL